MKGKRRWNEWRKSREGREIRKKKVRKKRREREIKTDRLGVRELIEERESV